MLSLLCKETKDLEGVDIVYFSMASLLMMGSNECCMVCTDS